MKRTRHSKTVSSSATLKRCFAALGAGTVAGSALAQTVLLTPPPPNLRLPELGSQVESAEETSVGTNQVAGANQPFRWRQLTFRPHASYDFLYGNGILSQTNREQKTIVQTISAGLTLDLGKRWQLDYTPSVVLYSDSDFKDSVNHSATLNGHLAYEDWTFGLDLGFTQTSDPLAQTGQQTDQRTYLASVDINRQLNGSLSAEMTAGINYRLAEDFNSSRDYTTTEWLNQQFGPNLAAGIGAGFGFEDASEGDDMTYERVLGRIIWHMTRKFQLSVNAGPEFRQFRDSNRDMLIEPIFGATLAYRLSDQTSLSINASRSIGASYFADEFTRTTSVNAALNRHFLEHYFVGLSAGYSFTDYESSSTSTGSQREDNNTFFSVSVGTTFLTRGSASVFYSVSDNSSTQDGFTYTSNQVGFSVKYAY